MRARRVAYGARSRGAVSRPGRREFGLENTVFALDDCFIEVVSPVRPDTAAGRHLERLGGDGGYMVIFDIEDLASARERAEARASGRLADRSAGHLQHVTCIQRTCAGRSSPSTAPSPTAPGAGEGRSGPDAWASGAPGRLAGVTLAVADPEGAAARWGAGARGAGGGGGELPSLSVRAPRSASRRSRARAREASSRSRRRRRVRCPEATCRLRRAAPAPLRLALSARSARRSAGRAARGSS